MKDRKNKFIFTAIDHFSKWMEAKIINSKEKEEIAKCIEELIIKKHGIPKRIMTDNGKEFKNSTCGELKRKYNFEWTFASPHHHKTMGAIERANQTLWQKIRKISEFGKKNWTKLIPQAVKAVNISFNRSIGTSPYILTKGETPILETDKEMGVRNKKIDINKLMEHIGIGRANYNAEIIKGKKNIPYDIEVGTPVLIFDSTPGDKMKARWKGGYWVTGRVEPDAYKVTDGRKQYQLNKSRIKRDRSE